MCHALLDMKTNNWQIHITLGDGGYTERKLEQAE